jgi:hypothetical protein
VLGNGNGREREKEEEEVEEEKFAGKRKARRLGACLFFLGRILLYLAF